MVAAVEAIKTGDLALAKAAAVTHLEDLADVTRRATSLTRRRMPKNKIIFMYDTLSRTSTLEGPFSSPSGMSITQRLANIIIYRTREEYDWSGFVRTSDLLDQCGTRRMFSEQ